MSIKKAALTILVLVLALTAGCGPKSGNLTVNAAAAVNVDSATNRPVAATDTFSQAAEAIYITTEIQGASKGAKLEFKVIWEDQEAVIATHTVTLEQGASRPYHAILRPSAGWSLGEYRVELKVDNNQVGTVFFRIRD